MKRASFDGMTWPVPGDDTGEIAWQLSNGKPSRSQAFQAASIIGAYHALVFMTERERRKVIREIRKEARRG